LYKDNLILWFGLRLKPLKGNKQAAPKKLLFTLRMVKFGFVIFTLNA